MRTRQKKGEPGYAEYRAHENERQAKRRASWASHGKRCRAIWREENRERCRESNRRWRENHPDANAASVARCKERHPHYWRDYFRRRKAERYLRDFANLVLDYRARCAAAEA